MNLAYYRFHFRQKTQQAILTNREYLVNYSNQEVILSLSTRTNYTKYFITDKLI